METLFDALQFNTDLPPDLLTFASNLGRSTKRDLFVVRVPSVVFSVVVSATTAVTWIVATLEDLCK